MARFPLFFVLAFVAIVALIGLAILPLRPTSVSAVEARNDQGTLIIDGPSLSQIRPARGFPVTFAPGPRGDQLGPRLASVSALAPDAQYSKGAQLMLGPQTISALKGQAYSVIIEARAVARTSASETGFGLVTGQPIGWAKIAIGSAFTPLRFDIPASDIALQGFAFWPAIEGKGHGIEIKSIAIQPTINQPLAAIPETP